MSESHGCTRHGLVGWTRGVGVLGARSWWCAEGLWVRHTGSVGHAGSAVGWFGRWVGGLCVCVGSHQL
jgi:hypothetical protein